MLSYDGWFGCRWLIGYVSPLCHFSGLLRGIYDKEWRQWFIMKTSRHNKPLYVGHLQSAPFIGKWEAVRTIKRCSSPQIYVTGRFSIMPQWLTLFSFCTVTMRTIIMWHRCTNTWIYNQGPIVKMETGHLETPVDVEAYCKRRTKDNFLLSWCTRNLTIFPPFSLFCSFFVFKSVLNSLIIIAQVRARLW